MLHNFITRSASKVFWSKLKACVAVCQRSDSQVDTHVKVTVYAESFLMIVLA